MSDPGWPLQQAIFAKLDAALTIDVLDFVPTDTARPYVTFGDDDLSENAPKNVDGFTVSLAILVVEDTHRGRKSVKETLSLIHTALHNQPLTVTGWEVAWLRFESSSTQRSEDGLTYIGVARYTASIAKAE